MSTATKGLPADFGKITGRFMLWMLLLTLGVCFGVYCYLQQEIHGDIVTGLRTVGAGGAGWGLYIVFVIFFIGVSFAGITVASLIRLFDLKTLDPLARMAELLTIVALLLGAASVLADLGQPLHGLLNLPRYARPTSPFFGTFTMVLGGYLFASLVYFFLAGRADAAYCAEHGNRRLRPLYKIWASGYRDTADHKARHHRTSFWLSLFILPLLITAHSTLGFIFGIQVGRPGWFSALQAPSFVVAAGVSGIGVLLVLAAVLRRLLHLQDSVTTEAFRFLGNFLWILIVALLYFVISEELTSNYAAAAAERNFAHVLTHGPYGGLFKLEIGSFVVALVILFAQFALKIVSIPWMVVAGLAVNVGAVLKRYLLVVPSQTHGMMLPYPEGHYSPTWVELGVIGGLFCLGFLLFSLFVKVFPIVPVSAHGADDLPAPTKAGPLRGVVTFTWLAVGLIVGVVGFAISSRWGTAYSSDPLIPFSPVMFIVGLMLVFSSGAIYELLPERRRKVETVGSGGTP